MCTDTVDPLRILILSLLLSLKLYCFELALWTILLSVCLSLDISYADTLWILLFALIFSLHIYRFVDQRTMEGSFQLNPNASPFIPGSLGSFAHKAPEKQGGETDYSSGSLGFENSDLLYSYDYTESSAGPIISAGSSSKGEPSGSSFDPSQHEENDMDELALANMVFSMFPNVSTDFIDELLKANDFDINLTLDMLHELNSQDMLPDDAEPTNDLPDDAEATTGLHKGQVF